MFTEPYLILHSAKDIRVGIIDFINHSLTSPATPSQPLISCPTTHWQENNVNKAFPTNRLSWFSGKINIIGCGLNIFNQICELLNTFSVKRHFSYNLPGWVGNGKWLVGQGQFRRKWLYRMKCSQTVTIYTSTIKWLTTYEMNRENHKNWCLFPSLDTLQAYGVIRGENVYSFVRVSTAFLPNSSWSSFMKLSENIFGMPIILHIVFFGDKERHFFDAPKRGILGYFEIPPSVFELKCSTFQNVSF